MLVCHMSIMYQFFLLCWKFWRWGVSGFRVGVGGWKLYRGIPRRALPIHFFRHFCCRMFHLATMHSITDRWHYDPVVFVVSTGKVFCMLLSVVYQTHPTFKDLIDCNSCIWTTCTFKDLWPNQLSIRHFERYYSLITFIICVISLSYNKASKKIWTGSNLTN